MVNVTGLLLSALPFCSYREIETNGSWVFPKALPRKAGSWDACPSTQLYTRNSRYMADDRKKFSCSGQNFQVAKFATTGCEIMQTNQSTTKLSHQRRKIVYVGDSMMRQLYVSSLCSGEYCHSLNHSQVHYVPDLFLRNDIPCDPRCATDIKFRQQKTFKHPCWACRKTGIKQNFSNYLTDTQTWHHKLPKEDIGALVIGSGAWYNSFQGIMNSTSTYMETLHAIGPILHDLNAKRGIEIFWVGLPPHNFNLTTANASMYGYEWIYFEQKDAIAKHILTPYGVTFVDTNVLTKSRKLKDPGIAADGIHWCNPGADSIPTFLNRIIFHLLAMRQLLLSPL